MCITSRPRFWERRVAMIPLDVDTLLAHLREQSPWSGVTRVTEVTPSAIPSNHAGQGPHLNYVAVAVIEAPCLISGMRRGDDGPRLPLPIDTHAFKHVVIACAIVDTWPVYEGIAAPGAEIALSWDEGVVDLRVGALGV